MNAKALLFAGAITMALSACERQESVPGSVTFRPSPIPPFTLSVTSNQVALIWAPSETTAACQSFAARFDLVIQNRGGSDLVLNAASFRLIDGSVLGGYPIPVPSMELTNRFGSPLIRPGTTRVFPFDERFGCGVSSPRSLLIEAVLVDVRGVAAPATLVVPVH